MKVKMDIYFRVFTILPESLNPLIWIHGDLNSSLEKLLLSLSFHMFVSSCGPLHLDMFLMCSKQNRDSWFSLPALTSTPSSLLQLFKTNIRSYPWFLFSFSFSHTLHAIHQQVQLVLYPQIDSFSPTPLLSSSASHRQPLPKLLQ